MRTQSKPTVEAPRAPMRDPIAAVFDEAAKAAAGTSDQWLIDWESHAPKIKPGIIMPSFAKADGGQLDPDQISALVAYLKSLK